MNPSLRKVEGDQILRDGAW